MRRRLLICLRWRYSKLYLALNLHLVHTDQSGVAGGIDFKSFLVFDVLDKARQIRQSDGLTVAAIRRLFEFVGRADQRVVLVDEEFEGRDRLPGNEEHGDAGLDIDLELKFGHMLRVRAQGRVVWNANVVANGDSVFANIIWITRISDREGFVSFVVSGKVRQINDIDRLRVPAEWALSRTVGLGRYIWVSKPESYIVWLGRNGEGIDGTGVDCDDHVVADWIYTASVRRVEAMSMYCQILVESDFKVVHAHVEVGRARQRQPVKELFPLWAFIDS